MPSVKTRFPVLLIHGLFGFDRIGKFQMFYGIKEALQAAGVDVYVPTLSAAQDNETRGAQLLEQIEKICEQSGAARVNLIGHSQGALTSRYAAAVRPERVASVTSVNGPNHGSEVADCLRQAFTPGALSEQIAAALTKGFVRFLGLIGNHSKLPQDPALALDALTTEGVSAFNKRYPQGLPSTWGGEGQEWVENVGYYSWSGVITGSAYAEGSNLADPLHLVCRSYLQLFDRERDQNDGLVGRFSSHLGKVIRSDYAMDHVDAINQTAGLVRSDVDPVALYVNHAQLLSSKGL